jgi:polyhydroxyalkanoate synthase
VRAPSQEPVKVGTVDVEEFSRNLARLVEEGGRALAAYLKPREQGRNADGAADEVAEVVKTLGQVAEYWLADPQRSLELQTRLGKAYLDLWASAVKRLAGEQAPPVAAPAANDKRFTDPEWSSNQFFDFLKQAYLLTTGWANQLVSDAADLDPHTRQKADFYIRQISQRAVAVELRADQSRTAARNAHVQRRKSGSRHAYAGRGHRRRRRSP